MSPFGLFDESPLLVEVRYLGCGTSPNWHLVHEETELEEIFAKVAPCVAFGRLVIL
jgi:hypothetical protein